MIKTRLIGLVPESKKYIAVNVVAQWLGLCASVVMMTNPGVASKMFEALYNEGINIKMISTSEVRITVLVDQDNADAAARAVHNAFVAQD